jgi:hypothetical protein
MDVMPRPLAQLVSLVVLLSVLAPAAATAATHTNAPPGNSAIDEYLETVPDASGGARPRPPRAHAGATLSPAQRSALQARGAEGEKLARVVDATAPPPAGAPAHGRASTGGSASASAPPERAAPRDTSAGRSPVAATLAAATGSDDGSSLGALLPAILVVSLIGTLAAFGRSRRHDRK